MADLTVTAADVRPLEGAIVRRYPAGGSVNVGDAIYLNGGSAVQTAAGTATMGSALFHGIVVSAPNGASVAAAGDSVDVVIFGPVAGFSNMTGGALAWVSKTAGKLADAQAGSGFYNCIAGIAESATVLFVRPMVESIEKQS